MEPLEIELEVGETLFLGDYSLTLLDTDGERIDVRIDSTEDLDAIGFDGHDRKIHARDRKK